MCPQCISLRNWWNPHLLAFIGFPANFLASNKSKNTTSSNNGTWIWIIVIPPCTNVTKPQFPQVLQLLQQKQWLNVNVISPWCFFFFLWCLQDNNCCNVIRCFYCSVIMLDWGVKPVTAGFSSYCFETRFIRYLFIFYVKQDLISKLQKEKDSNITGSWYDSTFSLVS